jgi:hypothetical protein
MPYEMNIRHSRTDLLIKREQLIEFAIQQQRRNLRDGVLGRCQPKLVTFTCTDDSLCGGLSDRIRGIIIGFFQSWLTDSVFLLDLSKPVPLNVFFDNLVMSSGTEKVLLACKQRLAGTTWTAIDTNVNKNFDYTAWNNISWVTVAANAPPYTNIWGNPNLQESLKTHGLTEMPYSLAASVTLAIYHGCPTELMQRLVDPVLGVLGPRHSDTFRIGLQIRTGNRPGFSDSETFHDVTSAVEFCREAVKTCLKRGGTRLCILYLTSDHPEAKLHTETYLSKLAARRGDIQHNGNVEYTDFFLEEMKIRLVYYESTILHVDKAQEHQGSVEAVGKTYIDWYILAYQTDFLLSSSSGFGISAILAMFTPHLIYTETGFVDSRLCSSHRCQILRGAWEYN